MTAKTSVQKEVSEHQIHKKKAKKSHQAAHQIAQKEPDTIRDSSNVEDEEKYLERLNIKDSIK